jgi:hypothetical protein
VPETAGSAAADEPVPPGAARPSRKANAQPLLSRVELELPDGRYLLSYRYLEEREGADA